MSEDELKKNGEAIGVQKFRELIEEIPTDSNSENSTDKELQDDYYMFNAKKDYFRLDDFLFDNLQKLDEFLEPVHSSINPFGFFYNVLAYIYRRVRVIFVLVSVLLEVSSAFFDNLKKSIIQNIFWGRGNLFKYTIQIITVFFIFIFLLFGNYRNKIVGDTEALRLQAYGSGREDVYVQNTDILVQNVTTNTDLPQNRSRVGIVDYEVKSGDSLFKIAQFFDITEQTLREANELSEVNIIRPGDILKIPPDDGVIVKVKKGDTLEALAKKYKGDTQAIAEVNWIDPPFDLKADSELFIPGGQLPKPKPTRRSYSGNIRTGGANVRYSGNVDPNVGRFLSWPVAGGRGHKTQCYHRYHNGVDIADGGMPDLVAAADGVVTFAGCHSGNCPPPGQLVGGSKGGWGVEVDHGNGYTTVYVHMYSIYVKPGQKVSKGQALGKMGMSGTATGIHVHFMVWKGGRWNNVNPAGYLDRHICGY